LETASRAPVAEWKHWTAAVHGLFDCMTIDNGEGIREVEAQLAEVRKNLATYERQGP
jgi:hypothetical protein